MSNNIKKEQYEAEFIDNINRFLSIPKQDINLEIKNEDGQVLMFADAIPEAYQDWLEIDSIWDRRSIIFEALDVIFAETQFANWQRAERLMEDRYPIKALEELNDSKFPGEEYVAEYWASCAKAYIILNDYNEAIKWAREGLEADPKHRRCKLMLADAHHLNNEFDQAHKIYDELLHEALGELNQSKEKIELSFQELLGFHGDILRSPIYAFNWLKNDKDTTEEIWDWAEGEFYFSPQFRTEHAYYLLEKGDTLKGFAKLLTLTREMPWVKEAVLNCLHLIDQLDKIVEAKDGKKFSDNFQEDKKRLQEIITDNNWTTDNMNLLGEFNIQL